MSRQITDFIGNNVSVGNGIKIFFKFRGEDLNTNDVVLKETGVAIEVGIINDVSFSVNRDISPNFLPGDRNAKGFNSGKRLVTGRISFSVMGRDFMDYIINVLLKDPLVANKLNPGKLFEVNGANFGSRTEPVPEGEVPTLYMKDKKLQYLDQLPLVDIIIVGKGDRINSLSGGTEADRTIFNVDKNFKMGAYYQMVLNRVQFLNDNFGFSAGAPVQDQVLDFVVVGSKESWKEVPVNG
jgi:hypothetical protein